MHSKGTPCSTLASECFPAETNRGRDALSLSLHHRGTGRARTRGSNAHEGKGSMKSHASFVPAIPKRLTGLFLAACLYPLAAQQTVGRGGPTPDPVATGTATLV